MKKETVVSIYAASATLMISGMLIHYHRFGSIPRSGYFMVGMLALAAVVSLRKKTT